MSPHSTYIFSFMFCLKIHEWSLSDGISRVNFKLPLKEAVPKDIDYFILSVSQEPSHQLLTNTIVQSLRYMYVVGTGIIWLVFFHLEFFSSTAFVLGFGFLPFFFDFGT